MILIFLIIGIVLYFFYSTMKENYTNTNTKIKNKTSKKICKKNGKNGTKKRVRFNDNIEYNIYSNKLRSTDTLSSPHSISGQYSTSDQHSKFDNCYISNEKSPNKIDVDSILSQVSSDCSMTDSINSESIQSENNQVVPSNLSDNAEDIWHSSFGKPLLTQQEKNKFTQKIQKNHKNYEKCLGQFVKYQMDDNIVIKTDTTIDPFKNPNDPNLKNMTIKDIYDKQVTGPKAKPKIIKKTTGNSVMYDDESELNGGFIKGTNLQGFDGTSDFKSAAFDNEF
ncbi:hypothetical protein QJ854_gp572 [Moumouvirus goulette]|uniref:Uncharacterized protein n=1 Tax=Moumouvirus goulette TaxID=1247379 RepID=M1NME2_9VIRU|nr:hypothetical protein QJ854_gp572 [Moumouvirus goulette]AGF85210.1 hypothetical protein glt_00401 [Moumouvirus goulette]